MSKYNRDMVCAKCGHHPALTKYVPEKTYCDANLVMPPRMVRTCPNCNYVWIEEPLDYDQEKWEQQARGIYDERP